jgi:hypothetical protein
LNHRQAEALLALLHHLDGSQVVDEQDLLLDVSLLFEAASGVPRSGSLPLDMDIIEDVLGEVAQRHADGGDWLSDYHRPGDLLGGRPISDTAVNGDVL